MREGVVIILEDRSGRIAMQLRDDRPEVVSAGPWGLFGGWIEPNESPQDAVLREIKEELNCGLPAAKLSFLESRPISWGTPPNTYLMLTHVLHYPVTDELHDAVLSEGRTFVFLPSSDITHKFVVPHHRAILNDYWRIK